jgi:hypothetical protein
LRTDALHHSRTRTQTGAVTDFGEDRFDDHRLGSHLDLFDHQPPYALAIGHIERFGSIVELGQEALEALGERDVRLRIQQLGVERRELVLDGHFAMSERRHTSPELVERNQLLLIRLDQSRERCPDAGQFLGGDVTFDVREMARAEVGQAAIDLGLDQEGIGEQLDDLVPDERSRASCRTGRLSQRRPCGKR